jgi:hypothetical protein
MASCGRFPLPYDEIVAWVDDHRATLPTTLAELSAYPVAFRRVIVETIPLLSDLFGSPQLEAQAKMRPLEERMGQLLTRSQCAVIFGMVGPPESCRGAAAAS